MTERWLDLWISKKLNTDKLDRKELEQYTEKKLIETFNYAKNNSPFYGELYKDYKVESLSDFQKLPFTTADDLRNRGMEMACVNQSKISRIVTLQTSGTTGSCKRIYFTPKDQELTVDYFANGMKLMTSPGEKVCILFPHTYEGSIGKLLQAGLEREGVEVTFNHNEKVNCIVGAPEEISHISCEKKELKPDRVLLSSEYVSETARRTITENWGCKIYEHYGMTEMGLGCAVSCGQGEGYHIRENDIYIEIVDSKDGEIISDERTGEIVFTTLTREGMPFIRYKTGDLSNWIEEECACGSVLKRIGRVRRK